jgi:hypothetical protein
MTKMNKSVKHHWKNGFNYQYDINGKKIVSWSYSLRLGNFGIMICKPSRVVSFINIHKLI